ncbi:MAG: ATP-binding cassette domain-containing protein [bacterium]
MISVEQLAVQQGSFTLQDVTFSVPTGRYAVLMGRTGTGKTTILEAIAGLRPLRAGRVRLCGVDVTRARPAERNIGYVPQDGALFSCMTVREHLAFALAIRREPKARIAARVQELAELLNIEPLLHRLPLGLSGGERQRVALGRALSFRPGILLLDEPLCAVDEDTRDDMVALLRRVQTDSGATVLHITHNPVDAVRLADLVLRLENGTVKA